MWLIGLIFKLRIGLIFQIHTAAVDKLVCLVYLHLEDNFYRICTEKVHLSEDVNNLWLISDILSNKYGFCVFSWFLTVTTTYFCQIPKMEIVDNKLILHPKSITVLVWFQSFMVKACFFIIQWLYQLWSITKLFKR